LSMLSSLKHSERTARNGGRSSNMWRLGPAHKLVRMPRSFLANWRRSIPNLMSSWTALILRLYITKSKMVL
jgi:hypothetical protein